MNSLSLQQALEAGRAFMRSQGNRMHAWLVQKSERGSRLIGLAYKPGGKVEARCVYQTAPVYADDLLLIARHLMEQQGRAPQVYESIRKLYSAGKREALQRLGTPPLLPVMADEVAAARLGSVSRPAGTADEHALPSVRH
ncbi:MAG TPA: hypothetical protein VK019_06260 [Pseudomonas sp.]|nr:hypothetical protein [Pseudomonas sp.]